MSEVSSKFFYENICKNYFKSGDFYRLELPWSFSDIHHNVFTVDPGEVMMFISFIQNITLGVGYDLRFLIRDKIVETDFDGFSIWSESEIVIRRYFTKIEL